MVFLRVLLIIIILFYLFQFLAKYFLKRFIQKNQQQYQRNQGSANKQRKEGNVDVEYKPKEDKHIPKDEGDYIDFEEIK